MAYEFKKLSDVETVESPADTANVLIEENGVIKKAPKTAVGGGGEWDAVITVDDVYNLNTDTVHLTNGGFDAIKTKVEANDLPKILIVVHYEYGDVYTNCTQPKETRFNHTDNNIGIEFFANWGSGYYLCLNADNTITF